MFNPDVIDRITESSRRQLATRLMLGSPIFDQDEVSTVIAEANSRERSCEHYHEGLTKALNYEGASELFYETLVDYIDSRQKEFDKNVEHETSAEAGEYLLIMPSGPETASAHLHEILFTYFAQAYCSGSWFENLQEYLDEGELERLRAERPVLDTLCTAFERGERTERHSIYATLLLVLPEDLYRFALCALPHRD